jgi:hypothetical protein
LHMLDSDIEPSTAAALLNFLVESKIS